MPCLMREWKRKFVLKKIVKNGQSSMSKDNVAQFKSRKKTKKNEQRLIWHEEIEFGIDTKEYNKEFDVFMKKL